MSARRRTADPLSAAFAAFLPALAAVLVPQVVQAQPPTLTATAGNEQATLNWTLSAPSNHDMWVYTQDDGQAQAVPSSNAATRSYTVTGLTNGTAYRFRVQPALRSEGSFFDLLPSASNEVTVTPEAPTPPGVTISPTALTIQEGGSGEYTVVLDKEPSATVTITVGGESGEVTVASSTLTFTANDYSTPQTVTVNAGGDADTTDDSATLTHAASGDEEYAALNIDSVQVTVTDTTPTVTAPAAPTGLAAAAGNEQVTLSWSDPGDPSISGYLVRQGQTSVRDSASWESVGGSGPGTTSHTVTGLVNDSEYSFQIRATNSAGDGDASGWVTATPTAPDDDGSNGDDGSGDDDDDGGDDGSGGGDSGDDGSGGGDSGDDGDDGSGGGDSGDDGDDGSGGGDSGDDGDDGSDDDDDDDDSSPGVPPTASFTLSVPCTDGLCRARTDIPVFFTDNSTGTVTSRKWSFGDGGAGASSPGARHQWPVPGFYTVSLTVSGEGTSSTASRKVLVEASSPAGTCGANDTTRCLRKSRFSVAVEWWTAEGGSRTPGVVVREGTDDSALFWFFSQANWELLVKVLDGCSLNGHVWVFGASATTLGYNIRVTDTATGATKEYRNQPGKRSSAITDNTAFPGACTGARTGASASAPATTGADPVVALQLTAAAATSAAESGSCTPAAGTLCLQDGRYEVSVDWSNGQSDEGKGSVARPRADDSGLFWFFSQANWELLVKVLDACTTNGHHWVFAASATDVGFVLQVRDTVTGQVKQYTHEAGAPARALADVTAFPDACTP